MNNEETRILDQNQTEEIIVKTSDMKSGIGEKVAYAASGFAAGVASGVAGSVFASTPSAEEVKEEIKEEAPKKETKAKKSSKKVEPKPEEVTEVTIEGVNEVPEGEEVKKDNSLILEEEPLVTEE